MIFHGWEESHPGSSEAKQRHVCAFQARKWHLVVMLVMFMDLFLFRRSGGGVRSDPSNPPGNPLGYGPSMIVLLCGLAASAMESITPSPPVSRSSREASPPRRAVPHFTKVHSVTASFSISLLPAPKTIEGGELTRVRLFVLLPSQAWISRPVK